jgi:hypothetical protein
MQALVEHYVAAGQPELVEQCVLKMDIMSLDLNQASNALCAFLVWLSRNGVPNRHIRAAAASRPPLAIWQPTTEQQQQQFPPALRPATANNQPLLKCVPPIACPALQLIPLCIQHRLFAALLHIFPAALLDYQTPAALLLVASAAAGEAEGAEAAAGEAAAAVVGSEAEPAALDALLQQRESLRLGYKLLLYIRCLLLGDKYPLGELLPAPMLAWRCSSSLTICHQTSH